MNINIQQLFDLTGKTALVTGSTSGIIEQPLFVPEHLSQPVGSMSRRSAATSICPFGVAGVTSGTTAPPRARGPPAR